MIKYKDFLLEQTERDAVMDYLESFTALKNINVTQKGTNITITVDGDIDSSMSEVNKALDGIGYEIENADNKETYVVYKCSPLK